MRLAARRLTLPTSPRSPGANPGQERTLRAVRCEAGSVVVTDVPAPSGPGVRVKVRSAGICGSDLHMVAGGYLRGVTIGHEIAGELADGTAVALEPISPCGSCEPCARGDYNLCERGPAIVHGVGRDGGMADEILVPERALVRLPSGVSLADASLVEPLAVAVHGFRRAGLRAGQRVAVVGGGSIGLCAVAVARFAGADVSLFARHDHQREAGERLGATAATDTDSGNFDLVVEAAGTESALARAVDLARPGGTLSVIASYWDAVTLPGVSLCMKEVNLVPGALYSGDGDVRDVETAAVVLAGSAELAPTMITHRFPLDAAAEAFAVAADRRSGAIKVVLEP